MLAVLVGPVDQPVRIAPSATGLRNQQIRLVRDLLAATGTEIDSAASHLCLGFDSWRTAIEAATALTSKIPRLTSPLAGLQVRVGLELSGTSDDAAGAERAAVIA